MDLDPADDLVTAVFANGVTAARARKNRPLADHAVINVYSSRGTVNFEVFHLGPKEWLVLEDNSRWADADSMVKHLVHQAGTQDAIRRLRGKTGSPRSNT